MIRQATTPRKNTPIIRIWSGIYATSNAAWAISARCPGHLSMRQATRRTTFLPDPLGCPLFPVPEFGQRLHVAEQAVRSKARLGRVDVRTHRMGMNAGHG